jgi:prepilin-type N-terminal cleavage/methylation domain-containing protein
VLQLENRNLMRARKQTGFSLVETMVALVVLSAVGGIVMTGLMQMMNAQASIATRTEMHTSVRSVTELLTQEIGQAGRIASPSSVTLSAAMAQDATTATVSSSAGMFVGENLVIDAGDNQETLAITGISGNALTFGTKSYHPHLNSAPVSVQGAFSAGIVPPSVNKGSTGTTLKLFGDINNDGNMLYIEYTCDTTTGFLYRQQLKFDDAPSTKISAATVTAAQEAAMALLSNLKPNPNDPNNVVVPCFRYQALNVPQYGDFVTDVEVTLTEQTQFKDPNTHDYGKETKALLNVAPRNVVDAWILASHGFAGRVQPTPATVTALLP